ncbi:MAG TPA: HNH endonuclease signature motif containing protein [Nitrososphaeraceae archaeon]|jgi:hypothetical protein
MTSQPFSFIFLIFSFILIFGPTDTFEKPISMDLAHVEELVIIILLLIGAFTWKLTHKTKERRYFSAEVKKQVIIDQKYKCAICKKSIGVWDYDHKDGNRSNNKISNCQALCPNCHAKKTRGLLKTKEKSQFRVKNILIIIIIIIFFVFLFYYSLQKNDILLKNEFIRCYTIIIEKIISMNLAV